jgi:hypothetical protein
MRLLQAAATRFSAMAPPNSASFSTDPLGIIVKGSYVLKWERAVCVMRGWTDGCGSFDLNIPALEGVYPRSPADHKLI